MQFISDSISPLIVFRHERAVATEPTEPEVDEVLGVVDDGIGGNQEVAVVSHMILHETAVLEVGIE